MVMAKPKTYLLQISSGRGPVECQLAVRKVVEEILRRTRNAEISGEIVSTQDGKKRGTYLSALVAITGPKALEFCRAWTGSIKWVNKSPFRPVHKRANWFVGVELISLTNQTSSDMRQADVHFETFGASGPGGQHTNKTDSAVRAKHIPSGHVVVVKSQRSQHANKKLALTLLKNEIEKDNQTNAKTDARAQWAKHEKLERGNPIKTFIGFGFKEKKK